MDDDLASVVFACGSDLDSSCASSSPDLLIYIVLAVVALILVDKVWMRLSAARERRAWLRRIETTRAQRRAAELNGEFLDAGDKDTRGRNAVK